jgi:SMC interacting uncharacterized protein involved in chromosome segregation
MTIQEVEELQNENEELKDKLAANWAGEHKRLKAELETLKEQLQGLNSAAIVANANLRISIFKKDIRIQELEAEVEQLKNDLQEEIWGDDW